MFRNREIELLEIIREIMHKFPPYENTQRYSLLERLRVLEVNIQRDANEYPNSNDEKTNG